MGRGEFSSLALYITPEALLRYTFLFPSMFMVGMLEVLFLIFGEMECVVDVGRSDTEGKRWWS